MLPVTVNDSGVPSVHMLPKCSAIAYLAIAVTNSAASAEIDAFSSVGAVAYGSSIPYTENRNNLYGEDEFSDNGGLARAETNYSGLDGTSSARSEASLANGTLKSYSEAFASSRNGTHGTFGFSRADFGDSFRTYSDDGPFKWHSSDRATFSIDLSGSVSNVSEISGHRSGASLYFLIYEPGTLDALARGKKAGGPQPDLSEYLLHRYSAGVGTDDYSFHTDYFDNIAAASAPLEFSFSPDGDFDWTVSLQTDANAGRGNSVVTDFFNTAAISYKGPTGTTTYSGSGFFPGTESLDELRAASVPEPSLVFLIGLFMVIIMSVARYGSTLVKN